jgi:hypothetical protein
MVQKINTKIVEFMEKKKVFINADMDDYDLIITDIKRKITFNSNDAELFIPAKEKEGYFFTSEELIEMRKKDYQNGFNQRGVNLDEIETPDKYINSLNIK